MASLHPAGRPGNSVTTAAWGPAMLQAALSDLGRAPWASLQTQKHLGDPWEARDLPGTTQSQEV